MTSPLISAQIRRYIVKSAAMFIFTTTLTFACLVGLWRFGSGEYLSDVKASVMLIGAVTLGALSAGLLNLWRLHKAVGRLTD